MRMKKLADAMTADGRTHRAIAKDAGMSATSLSLILNGRRTAKLETAYRIARVLGRAPEDLGLPSLGALGVGGAR